MLKKRLVLFAVVTAMIMSFSTNALALEMLETNQMAEVSTKTYSFGEKEIKVVNLAEGISEAHVAKIAQSVSGEEIDEHGNVNYLETTVTIKNVEAPWYMYNPGEMYDVGVTALVDTSSQSSSTQQTSKYNDVNTSDITAALFIRLRWSTIPGETNMIKMISIYTHPNVEEGTIDSSNVNYYRPGQSGSGDSKDLGDRTTGHTWTLNRNFISPKAVYAVKFNESIFERYVSVSAP